MQVASMGNIAVMFVGRAVGGLVSSPLESLGITLLIGDVPGSRCSEHARAPLYC